MNSRSKKETKKAAVLPYMCEAGFFVDRGMRFLHRSDYDRALRCFRRAVELEPSNPENLCHLAGVLAETGEFESSNDLLFQVVNEIAPEKSEVLFYLANNFANMEEYEKAEEMALRYLQESERVEYQEEAHDLLEYIYFEMGVSPRRYFGTPLESLYIKHDAARKSLEEGKFFEAIRTLEEIIEEKADFIPACNNLALAYYYTGSIDKAMEMIDKTLEHEPGNLHALCNLAILLAHCNRMTELFPLLEELKKVVPFHPEYAYKLATTMGVLGQHNDAYQLFLRLFRRSFPQEASALHFAAISAYSTNRIDQAIRWWQKAKQMDPDAGIADYYLQMAQDRLNGKQGNEQDRKPIPYYYHQPMEPLPEEMKWSSVEEVKDDSMIRSSLLWALQYGKEDVQEMVIQTLGMIGDEEARSTLQSFSETTASAKLKQKARVMLKQLNTRKKKQSVSEGVTSRASEGFLEEPAADDQVSASIKESFLSDDDKELREWALLRWAEYVAKTAKPMQVRKAVAWTAALEYLYMKNMSIKVSQASLAEKFDISTSTLAKCVKELSVLDLNLF